MLKALNSTLTVDFKNVVIVMTSNLGSEHFHNLYQPIGFLPNGKSGKSKKESGEDEGRAREMLSRSSISARS